MSTPRFHIDELRPGRLALDEEESRHALLSLRLRPGDAVALFDGRGHVADGTLADEAGGRRRRQATVVVDDVRTALPPARPLTVWVAGCKGPRLAWLVEKCTELGVTRLAFTTFTRSVVHVEAELGPKLRRTALEAAKQSGAVWLPELTGGATLAQRLAAPRDGAIVVTHPAPGAPPLGAWLASMGAPAPLTAVIGPEGGLTDEELSALRAGGAVVVGLGSQILRVETAALAVAATWAAWA